MSIANRNSVIRPGLFGTAVAADTRRWEFDLGNELLITTGMRPDAVFVGDSITHFWELQASFGGTGKTVVNRGIGGDTTEYVARRFQADALQLQPGLIVLMIGTNDMGWMLEQLSEDVNDRICSNIRAMALQAQEAGIRIVLGSILPVWGPSGYPVEAFTARKNAMIVECNQRIKLIAEELGVAYVDYHSRMLDAAGCLRRELAEDGVHPHSTGYAIMADILRETLADKGIDVLL